jgi:molybdate transport system substrate-binding protein
MQFRRTIGVSSRTVHPVGGAAARGLPGSLWVAVAALAFLGACAAPGQGGNVSVAVAANFTEPAKEIAQLFREATGYSAVISFGSTGQLFTQITQDAPFEVFLAADQETPRKAVREGFGAGDSVMTYAVGKVVLFSATLDLTNGEAVLREGRFGKLAIANPVTAPYGAAAVEAMKALGVEEQLRERIVQGNNIAQAFQFVETGNAEVGFVALSQVFGKESRSKWIVPEALYSPIRQDAVMTLKGRQNPAAAAFMKFLRTPAVLAVIEKYGYTASP